MSIAMLMAMASCSSSDDEVAEIKEESKLVPMTFTATQESNVGTRAVLNIDNKVGWQENDEISIFDGLGNQRFTLTGEVTEGIFSGEASSTAESFTAVYPYNENAQLRESNVSGIELPAIQTATLGSFDPKAALMMAYTEDKSQLNFKNAVSLVKVTTEFPCKKIVLTADVDIAGTGTLKYNEGTPSITFESNQSKTITLKPETGSDSFAAGTYYIAVPPITLTNGFSISFHASDEYCVYTRRSTQSNTFKRSMIKDFGTFKKTGNEWEWSHTSRGKVDASQEVDMGVFNINGTDYRLIFTNANLKENGLAESEIAYGDYFAWGATEPWYSSISGSSFNWKNGYEKGYISDSYKNYINGKSIAENNVLKMEYDPARKILEGDWQIPTKAIWEALVANSSSKGWDVDKDGYKFVNNGKTLFLPAAGYVKLTSFKDGRSYGHYWSGTAGTSQFEKDAYFLYFYSSKVEAPSTSTDREYGRSVRPVRLVAVD